MPGSPDSSTTWPSPSCARFQRSSNRPSSCSRPTKPVSRPLRTASKRPSDADTPSTAQASTGSARPLTSCRPSAAQLEQIADQPAGGRSNDHGPRLGQSPAAAPPGSASRRPPPAPAKAPSPIEIADHDEPGGDADAHLQRLGGGDAAHRLDHREAGAHRALGIVFVGARKAEINQHAVAHVFGDEAVEAAHRRRHAAVIGADHLAQLLGIEPRRQCRRADQVAEHHG